ncbi:MAG: CotH kinase family protein [Paludibacteraceae bacterium]|nr:CotH kinase family protein [Paludibacteraceae bacterium]
MQRKTLQLIFILSFFFIAQILKAQNVHHWETAIFNSDTWKYYVAVEEPPANWRMLTFEDASWSSGKGGFGYNDNDDGTIIWKDGDGEKPYSVYMRTKFNLTDTSKLSMAVFHIDYDDAFVAYINDTEIARVGLYGTYPPFDQLGTNHDAVMPWGGEPDEFVLDMRTIRKILSPGQNVLSIQVHNSSRHSSDMTSNAFLTFGIKDKSSFFRATPTWFKAPANIQTLSSNLPLILITCNTTIPDEPKVEADMKIIYNGPGELNYSTDEPNVYNGKIGIERRGRSSYNFPQRPYAIETRDNLGANQDTSLLGMPRENDWVLLSNWNDKAFVRNILAFELFSTMGHYAPRVRLAEMVLNNDYQGIYLFGEKIKQDKNRLDIANLALHDTVGNDLTGGYIFKTDYDDGYGTYWVSDFSPVNRPGATVKYIYQDPKPSLMTWHQKEYIAAYVNAVENVLYSDQFTDPVAGYKAYIDVNSFIDYLIISELSRNVDGYKKSRFFYKDKDSNNPKVHSGPVWDYDWAWKNLNDCFLYRNTDGSGWAYDINQCGVSPVPPSWEARMLEDPAFANALYARWFGLRRTLIHQAKLNQIIDSVASMVNEAQVRHYDKYQTLGSNNGAPEIDAIPTTFAGEVHKLKNWIATRIDWLDANMLGEMPTVVNQVSIAPVRIFPNPVSGPLFVESDIEVRRIMITNVMGRTIFVENPGQTHNALNISLLSPGVYNIKVTLENGQTHTQKLLKK